MGEGSDAFDDSSDGVWVLLLCNVVQFGVCVDVKRLVVVVDNCAPGITSLFIFELFLISVLLLVSMLQILSELMLIAVPLFISVLLCIPVLLFTVVLFISVSLLIIVLLFMFMLLVLSEISTAVVVPFSTLAKGVVKSVLAVVTLGGSNVSMVGNASVVSCILADTSGVDTDISDGYNVADEVTEYAVGVGSVPLVIMSDLFELVCPVVDCWIAIIVVTSGRVVVGELDNDARVELAVVSEVAVVFTTMPVVESNILVLTPAIATIVLGSPVGLVVDLTEDVVFADKVVTVVDVAVDVVVAAAVDVVVEVVVDVVVGAVVVFVVGVVVDVVVGIVVVVVEVVEVVVTSILSGSTMCDTTFCIFVTIFISVVLNSK